MIICKNCGSPITYTGRNCPVCGAAITFEKEEIKEHKRALAEAVSAKDYETVLEEHHILADAGIAESQREYGRFLEKGNMVERDLDLAMQYFRRAAEQNDAYAAYRYSHLAGRVNSGVAEFWLLYSAVLGCKEAFPEVAEYFSSHGDEETANYYYAICADCEDTDSIVTMAKRYYNGVGCEKSEEYAKWYLDRFNLPPITVIRMAYRLRNVKAKQPPRHTLRDYPRFLSRLIRDAEKYKIDSAYLRLNEIMAQLGDLHAEAVSGKLYAEGRGCTPDGARAVTTLIAAASHGATEAYVYLGDIYLDGKGVPADPDKAIKYYMSAGESGDMSALETVGDLLCDGDYVPRDIPRAIELYSRAAAGGNRSASEKADELTGKRENCFERAKDPETPREAAFRLYAVVVAMGYVPAMRELAICYRDGVGTEVDRRRAFTYFDKAVRSGDRSAIYDLGLCYENGIGTERNGNAAEKLFAIAARMGTPGAEEELDALRERREKKLSQSYYSAGMALLWQKKNEISAKYLALATRGGHAKAIYTLGCYFEFGIGLPTDRTKAFALYEQAFSLGFRDPRAEYKLKVLRIMRSKR